MNKLFITSTALLLCGNALAYGEAGRWSSGWGQGTSEYTAVVNEQNNLYIACNDTRKVSMTATVQGKEYGSYAGQAFAIIVDGSQYDAPYETESRVGENNFFDMWGKLRQAKSISIVTADGKQLALPTKEVASVLPATGTPDFGCLMWDESEDPTPAAPSTPPAPVTATLPSSTFDVSWKIEYMLNMPAKMLQIVSHHDNITIQNATINRGNCPFPLEKLPLTFRFGGTAKFFVPQKCNILEVHVFTNQGEALYQFDSQS